MTTKKHPDKLLKKGPPSTFKGGSKLKTYRVPGDPKQFAECDKEIQKVINGFKIKTKEGK